MSGSSFKIRLLKILGVGIASLVALGLIGGWYFSGQIHSELMQVKTYDLYNHDATFLSSEQVELPRDSYLAEAAGVRGLRWKSARHAPTPDGYGRLGEVLGGDAESLIRRFQPLQGEPPTGDPVAIYLTNYLYYGTPGSALSLDYEEVKYQSPLGMMPAWHIPADSSNWVIMVHGRGGDREFYLKDLPFFNAHKINSLAISYRNDPDAPADPSERHQAGQTEWHDLAAAVQFAKEAGAKKIILYGESMGGSLIMSYLRNGDPDPEVVALILDSPLLDVEASVEFGADNFGFPVPGSLRFMAKRFASLRYGLDWAALDYTSSTDYWDQPALIFHGTNDMIVPHYVSAELAQELPARVTYVETSADHVASWHLDPEAYTTEIATFMTGLELD